MRCRENRGTASEPFDDGVPELDKTPEAGARFDPLPAELSRAKSYAGWIKSLKSFLYRERTLRVWNCPALKEWSRPLETEREFRLRLVQASREKRDHGVEALRARYAPKLEAIQEQMRRAREKLEREQAQASKTSWDATIALGSSVLGAILGRKAISEDLGRQGDNGGEGCHACGPTTWRCKPGGVFARFTQTETRRSAGQVSGGDRGDGSGTAA